MTKRNQPSLNDAYRDSLEGHADKRQEVHGGDLGELGALPEELGHHRTPRAGRDGGGDVWELRDVDRIGFL